MCMIQARVNADLKKEAEEILDELGLSGSSHFTNCVGYETFTVTDAYDASAPVMLRNVKKNLSVKKNFQLSNKK